MILHKMKLDEANILEFDLQVFGTTEKTSEIRFLIEGSDYSILCKCIAENGSVTVQIPKMKGILPAGVYESKLEVIIDGKIFTPLSESVEFEPLIEFDVETKKVNSIKEGVSVSLKNASPRFEASTPSNYDLAAQEGFVIEQFNGIDVLKKDNKYFGFVSDKAYLKTSNKDGFSSIVQLMDSV